MKIILADDVRGLGHRGDTVTVKPGYARNFLFPQGVAYEATTANVQKLSEQKKKYEDAIGALREGIRLWGSTDGMMLAQLQAASPGHRNEALEGLEKIKSRPESSTQPYLMALIYGALGDREKTFEWLEKAHGQRDVWFLYANVDPRLDGMRGDPRFQQLIKHQ